MAGFLMRLDDAINPIVVKELRQAVKSRFVVAVLLIFLLLQIGWIGYQLLALGFQGRIESLDFQGGRDVFVALQVILLATCLLFIPLYTAIRLAAERNEANIDLLFVTTIQPRSIIAGKIFSAVVLAILIFSACMPFMGLTYYLRGIDWATILFVLAIDFLVVIVSVQLMVFLAVVPTNFVFKALLGLFGLWCLAMIFGMTMSTTSMMMYANINWMTNPNFWYGCAGTVLLVAAVGGLFFTWSVALVSSPSSNRALGVRLYMFVLTVVSSAIAIGLSYCVETEGPFIIWMWVATILASVYAIIAINERREWSARIARRIPASFLSRVVAFPLFSGAAGGMVFSVAMMAVVFGSALGFAFWTEYITNPLFHHVAGGIGPRDRLLWLTIEATTQAFLYAYCYCLTAVCVHRWVFPSLKPTLTWVVLLCIFALGMVLPYLISFLVLLDRWDYNRNFFWLLSNPFVAIYETTNTNQVWPSHDYRIIFWLFLGGWTAIATLFNVRWFFGQFAKFRRVDLVPSLEAMESPAGTAVGPIGGAAP